MKSVFLPKDDRGKTLHAHGGQILIENGFYYWIGENRIQRAKVSCYKSKDFLNWEFCNHVLTLDSEVEDRFSDRDLRLDIPEQKAKIGMGCNIERPKIIYNKKTKQYVMWMHWEMPQDYKMAKCAVAVCDTIDGNYRYLGSFNPMGYMSRDCTLFVDDDDCAYFVSTARDNQDLHIYHLTEDYLSIESKICTLWAGQLREAPVLFKRKGYYYLLTSGCTGWKPNQSSYAYSRYIDHGWSKCFKLGNETTYQSQPTGVIKTDNLLSGEQEYWYLGDRWCGEQEFYFRSEYVILPLIFLSDTNLCLDWKEDIEPEMWHIKGENL